MPDQPEPDTNPMLLLEEVRQAASSGDWQRLEELSALLPSLPAPGDEVATAQYLFSLRASIIAARTVRADIVKSLHRLSAASSFNQCG